MFFLFFYYNLASLSVFRKMGFWIILLEMYLKQINLSKWKTSIIFDVNFYEPSLNILLFFCLNFTLCSLMPFLVCILLPQMSA